MGIMDGSQIDDFATTIPIPFLLINHNCCCSSTNAKSAKKIDIKNTLPLAFCKFKQADGYLNCCTMNQNIQSTMLFFHVIQQMFDLILIRYISDSHLSLKPILANKSYCCSSSLRL